MAIKKVLVIYKTHLDIGFTDFSKNVVNTYMEKFIPNALSIAKSLRESNGDEKLIWTTGSWLIYEYLRTHKGKEREKLIEGIISGDISWHGLPFTTHTELMSSELFEYGLSLSTKLDSQFGKKTIAAKLTDVPGHTRAIIPYMRNAGIEFLHIGVNPASAVPEVPNIFKWRAVTGETLTVMYQKDYGEFTEIGDTGVAVYFAHTGDNMGVQTKEDIKKIFDNLRLKLPEAEIVAADLNELAHMVRDIEDSLPVVDKEIGDSWIHGAGTDPGKVNMFKGLERLWKEMPECQDKDILARGLIMIPEHTWGLDVKTHLKDHDHYDKKAFYEIKDVAPNYKKMAESWKEQRAYLLDAVSNLSSEWKEKAGRIINEASRDEVDVTSYERIDSGERIIIGNYELAFDDVGQIIYLKKGENLIADENHALITIMYEQFCGDDYERFFSQYNRLDEEWAIEDFKKPGMEKVTTEHIKVFPKVVQCYKKDDRVVVKYEFEEKAYENYGCPLRMEAILEPKENGLGIDVAWFDKPANRIAEALWLGFEPIGSKKKVRKLSTWIDTANIVYKGQCKLHGTDYGIRYKELEIISKDTALVAPDEPSLLNYNSDKPKTSKAYFNLHNNIWGTNFPMWYEEDARFRFELKIK